MADVSQTATSVEPVSGTPKTGTAGASIVPGNVIYLDADTSKYKLADADASAAQAAAVGIATSYATDGSSVHFLGRGSIIDVGGTLVKGMPYFVSGTAGKIAPAADLATGDWSTFLGIAASTTNLDMTDFKATGYQLA